MIHFSPLLNKKMLPFQIGDVPASHANIGDLIEDSKDKPNTSIQERINMFIDWYLEFYKGLQQNI